MNNRTAPRPQYSRDYAMTAEEVGRELGIGKSYVSVIERQALTKLRTIFEARGIRLDDLMVDDNDAIEEGE